MSNLYNYNTTHKTNKGVTNYEEQTAFYWNCTSGYAATYPAGNPTTQKALLRKLPELFL